MNQINIIKEIENNYAVENISCNDLPVWQYLRNLLYNQSIPSSPQYPLNRIKNGYFMLKNYRWGNSSKTKEYKYLLFTDFYEQKLYNNKYIDKTAQNLIELLEDELLVAINPSGQLHNKSSKHHINHMSTSFFHYQRWLSGLEKPADIKNKVLLDQILKKYELELNVPYYNKLFFTYIKIFTDWLTIVRPQAVFINCYYSLFHQALIYSCKKKRIQTIELQHGLISKGHIQYSPQKFIGTDTFPDYMLTHGNYIENSINTNFIDFNNIIPVVS